MSFHLSSYGFKGSSSMVSRPILDADFSAVEARIVAWLAGQTDVLDQYRRYDAAPLKSKEREALCLYRTLAAMIYSIPVDEVQKHPHRLVGKTARLGLGFQMGPPKFRDSVKKFGYELPEGLEFKAVETYRATNPAIKAYWYDVEVAAKRAILHPGQVFIPPNKKNYTRPEVSFSVREVGGIPFLFAKLPSGRKLSYPQPRLSNDRITFYGNQKGVNWGDVDTYSGRLVENLTQAVAADIMCNGAQNAEDVGYEICALIHDQALAYHQPHQSPEEFVKLLTDLPSWAVGLPIAAEGALTPFYRKD